MVRIICKGKFDHSGTHESAVYLEQEIVVWGRRGVSRRGGPKF